ncbi:MAG TPA: hypothetical protein ENN73_01170 [Firmicutes bacterium]|nr:hypothetical protein [Bacillota bacterium]
MKKGSLFIIFSLILSCFILFSGTRHHGRKNHWKEHIREVGGEKETVFYFVQNSVRKADLEKGIMEGKVEGRWRKFKSISLPEEFLDWSFSKRIETIEGIKTMKMPGLAGPHNAIVASHGMVRKDSMYSINNAVKGVGFLPKKDKLKDVIKHLTETCAGPMEEKLEYLISMYKDGKELFDIDKQVSLELYSAPDFETHSFLNAMTDPGVAIVFLDIPSYELRCITYMIHPDNPNLTDYEKDIVQYINLIHSYFHGEFPKDYIAVVYYVVEVFNNTPGKRDGLGQKVMPKIP